MGGILGFAISTDKSIAGVVEDVEEAIVERQSGTEDSGQDNLVRRYIYLCSAQRCDDTLGFVVQRLGDFKSLELADAHDIVAEKQSVLLIVLVADFCQILVDDRILFRKINDIHSLS